MNKYVLIIFIVFILYLICIELKKRTIYKPSKQTSIQEFYLEIGKYIKRWRGQLSEIYLPTDDGYNIHMLMIKNPAIKKYILFCHNGEGNITDLLNYIYCLAPYCNLILFDYTSFGNSNGTRPDEKIVKNNVLTVWNYLTQDLDLYPDDITIMGDGLGSAVAIWLTSFISSYDLKPHALIIQNSFTRLSHMYPIFTHPFMQEYNSSEHINNISKDVTIVFIQDVNKHYQLGVKLYNHLMANRVYTDNTYFHSIKRYCDSKYISYLKNFL